MCHISDKKRKNEIISNILFDNKSCIAFCVRIERHMIIEEIKEKRKIIRKNISKGKILFHYHNIVFYMLKKHIEIFLHKHNCVLSDISFECDSDCQNLIQDCHLRHSDRGIAHMMSDIVAWSNNKGKEPKGVIVLDFTKKIRKEISRWKSNSFFASQMMFSSVSTDSQQLFQ